MALTDTRDRLAATYFEAMESSHASGVVSIHVGQQVWDDMKALANVGRPQDEPVVSPAMAWGFPVVLEPEFLPDTIKVRSTKVIH
jgi:hypothetical protein